MTAAVWPWWRPTDPPEPVLRRTLDDPTGRVIPVLYPTDVDCSDMPQVKTGDMIDGLSGVLIYNFDEFKILMDDAGQTDNHARRIRAVDVPYRRWPRVSLAR